MTSISMRTMAASSPYPRRASFTHLWRTLAVRRGQVVAVAMSDGRLPSTICVPAGHSPSGYVHATAGNAQVGGSGYKTDPGGPPCDARVPHVLKIDPQTGNAIHPYGPPGCDTSLPVIGLGQ